MHSPPELHAFFWGRPKAEWLLARRSYNPNWYLKTLKDEKIRV